VRDFGNWERKGPLSPAPGAGPPVRDGGRLRDAGDPRERRGSPAGWGEGREGRDGQSDAGSRPPRREFEPRPVVERAPTAAEADSQWRSKMRPDPSPAPTPDISTPASPAQDAPKERPRLNLTKRTVSTAEPGSATTPAGDAKASPFGAARPIDTQQREREIEEKRQLALRQKKEADDKAREEKAARDAASRAARGDRADRGQTEEGEKVTSPTGDRPRGDRRPSRQQQAKENGEGATQAAKPSFSILQREDGEEAEDADAVDASANGNIVGDKETKPQEVVVPAGANAESTAEALEDDGWSTVAAKPKNNRRGGARALAS
jgi:translation initiation factor 4B